MYHSWEQQTTQQWVSNAFAGGDTCLLKHESLSLDEEIGEGAFGKVFKGLFVQLFPARRSACGDLHSMCVSW